MKNKGKTENGKGKKLVEIYELDMEGEGIMSWKI